MKQPSNHTLAMVAILVVSAALRFYGLGWGTDRQTGTFHTFHPDERTVVDNARWVGQDLSRITTPYGNAPLYLLWASARTAGLLGGFDPFDLQDNHTARFTFILARGLSALFSTLTVWVLFCIGCRLGGIYVGLLAALFLGFSPGHIQQAHYYTVDGPFTFWATLAVALMLRMPQARWMDYLACGAVCGIAAGTRLAGVWLAPAFLLVQLWPAEGRRFWHLSWRNLISTNVGIYVSAVLLLFLLCEPYLLLDPNRFFTDDGAFTMMGSLEIVRGGTIYVWTLFDLSTPRFLYQVTHLLRYALGTPLEVVGLLGVLWALWSRTRRAWVLLAWMIPYYLVIGSLVAKPVRYTTPLMAGLAVLGAWLCVEAALRLRSRWPRLPLWVLPPLLIALPTALHGLAFTRIYRQEDARIVASRWIADNVPQGTTVLTERGGFPTHWMVNTDRYTKRVDEATFLIVDDGCVTYGSKIETLRRTLAGVEWVITIEENRTRQFQRVPARFPVGCGFYQRLGGESLGYDRVMRFRTTPWLTRTGLYEAMEPTATAFDHPTVSIYQRNHAVDLDALFAEWLAEVSQDPDVPDVHFTRAIEEFRDEGWVAARQALQVAISRSPDYLLSHLMLWYVSVAEKDSAAAAQAWRRALTFPRIKLVRALGTLFTTGLAQEARTFIDSGVALGPKHADAITLKLAFVEYALRSIEQELWTVAEHSIQIAQMFDETDAQTWYVTAKLYSRTDRLGEARVAILRAIDLNRSQDNYQKFHTSIANDYHERGNLEMARQVYLEALSLNPNRWLTHRNLGAVALDAQDFNAASKHFEHAVIASPTDWESHLALGYLQIRSGRAERAAKALRRVLELSPGNQRAIAGLKMIAVDPLE